MQLTIEKLGHLGDGIAQGPHHPVYIPQTLPGEVVEGEIEGERLTGMRIATPSPERVKPPCPHARSCGGCLMQHASDSFVAEWKQGIIRGALAGQGIEAALRPILTSPAQSRRRATLTGRKTKGGTLMGFHARASDTLVAVPNCKLLDPGLIAAFPALERLIRIGGTRSTELTLTITRSLAGADIAVSGGKALDQNLRLDLARACEQGGIARLSWNDEVVAFAAPPVQRFGSALVTPPPGAFLQATPQGETSLVSAIREAIGPARRVIDLFAGCGTFSLPLAAQAEVHAVEGLAALTQALDRAARATPGLRRVSVETRDLFRRPLEVEEFKGVDAVVIDPPRAGAEAQTRRLAEARVPVIAAVSCNPVTFARDARILLANGYRLDWIQGVDQFRWSSHVEIAAKFQLP
jgi:23S rRNA (uracil1939-C5)-methyltransferase